MFEFWNLTFLQLLQSWSSAGAQWREDAQHHCWLLTAWLMSIFAGLMGSVLCGIMCLMINFSSMGHVSSVNESVTLMHAQKMTFIFTLGTERESQIVCVRVCEGNSKRDKDAISLVRKVMHAWRNQWGRLAVPFPEQGRERCFCLLP